MSSLIINKLIHDFKDRESFSREELFTFFRHFYPGLKDKKLSWRISELKNKNIIRSLKRGIYTISEKPIYNPAISNHGVLLAKMIVEQFSHIDYCISETQWLNEFSQHQSSKRMIVIEVEKDFVESLFFNLRDTFPEFDFYINPDEKTFYYYVSESIKPVIIKKLISRSPIQKHKVQDVEIALPQIEKLLVDIFVDEKLYYPFQGYELVYMYENALKNYAVNFSTLFSYSKRRGKESEIREFLSEHLGHLVNGIIDD